jgi:hypothetical protein
MGFNKANIGRFNESLQAIPFNEGIDTVAKLLEKANITLESGEEINDADANKVSPAELATEQDYFVVSNYKNGLSC